MGAFHLCLRPALQLLAASAVTTAATVTQGPGPALLESLTGSCLPGPLLAPVHREVPSAGTGRDGSPEQARERVPSALLRPRTVGKQIGRGCVPMKLLVWKLKPEFLFIFTCHEILFFFLFLTSLKMCKPFLVHRAVQNTGSGLALARGP